MMNMLIFSRYAKAMIGSPCTYAHTFQRERDGGSRLYVSAGLSPRSCRLNNAVGRAG